MNILLVSLNSKYVHVAPAPYCLVAGVKAYAKEQHKVQVLNCTVNEKREDLLQKIRSYQADIIGFCCYIWNIKTVLSLLPDIKTENNFVVLGGPEVSYCTEKILSEQPLVDAVLSGEGEEPFALLCDRLAKQQDLSAVPGLSYRNGRSLILDPPHLPSGTPPLPYDAGYIDALGGRIAYVETSRGCPYSCAFCLSGRCGTVRFFDLDTLLPAIVRLANSGTKTVKFVDRTFNADKKRALFIWQYLCERRSTEIPADVCFHFEIAGDILDEAALAFFATVPHGYFQFEIGLQSFHPQTLSAIHRSPKTERLAENIKRLVSFGNMHIHIDLIAGLPQEDLATFRQSFTRAIDLRPHMLQLGFLKLLHGAPMREDAEAFPCAYSQEPPYEVQNTPWLSEQDIAKLHLVDKGVDRIYNSGRYPETLKLFSAVPPFDLYSAVGQAMVGKSLSLHLECQILTELGKTYGIDSDILRDALLLDYITHTSARDIPAVLRKKDARYSSVRDRLAKEYPREKDIYRTIVFLYTRNECAFVDYKEKDCITGAYPVQFISLP